MPKAASLNSKLFLLVSDIALTLICLSLARLARLAWPLGSVISHERAVDLPLVIYLLVAVLWFLLFSVLGVYATRRMHNLLDEVQAVVAAILICTVALAGVLYLTFRMVPRLLFIYFCLFDLIALVGSRILRRLVMRLRTGNHRTVSRVLILGAGVVGRRLADALASERGRPVTRIVGFLDDDASKQGAVIDGIPVLGSLDTVCAAITEQHIDEVIFSLPLHAHQRLIDMILDLGKMPVEVKVVPDLFDLAVSQHIKVENVGALPLISLRESAINGYSRWIKRVCDVIGASLVLILASPLFAAIAIAVKLDSPGPAIFKQKRVGENGRLFTMYKFRTMVDGAEKQFEQVIEHTPDGKLIHKKQDDPRITALGRFLRRSSMDELPQFFNILKGEMSMVGPRPELPYIVERYEPWQRRRLSVPPGLTGWWQISGRSDKPMHLHTEDDLYYIQNYSLLLDLHIIVKTLGEVMRGRGAF